jgi:NADH pyrophosphatase NudC (nudix superfamily)
VITTFSGAALDRLVERRADDAGSPGGCVTRRRGRSSPAPRRAHRGRQARAAAAAGGAQEAVLLGAEDGVALFAVEAPADAPLTDLREAAATLPQGEGGLAAYASALLAWQRTHRTARAAARAPLPRRPGTSAAARRAARRTTRARTRS